MVFSRRVISESDLTRTDHAAPTGSTADDYSGRLLKYIPAETVAGFVTINGLLSSVLGVPVAFQWFVFAVLTALTAGYAWKSTHIQGMNPAYLQICIQTAGFVIWVASLGGPFATLIGYQSYYSATILILYTIFIPLVT